MLRDGIGEINGIRNLNLKRTQNCRKNLVDSVSLRGLEKLPK